MPDLKISDVISLKSRFLRSVHLERDFANAGALDGYTLTRQCESYLERLASGLAPNSSQRAWRVTGDFGSGKSSFALLTAHLFGRTTAALPQRLRNVVNFEASGTSAPDLCPILVTGSREPLSTALLRSLHRELLNGMVKRRSSAVVDRLAAALSRAEDARLPDDVVVELLHEAAEYIKSSARGCGLLIILDELGKFLEYAALHPERQDIYVLQAIAELSARSGGTPIMVLGILHQGFNAYADQLAQSTQREWEKIAGRFDELIFDQPLEQSASLVGAALDVATDKLPPATVKRLRLDMAAAVKAGWYGASASQSSLTELATSLFPLHPTVYPALARLFARFGQNERSLFSFLLSNEPFGLLEFVESPLKGVRLYTLSDLYDFARATFGYRLSLQNYRGHWAEIESLIATFATQNVLEIRILKTVGLLNILDSPHLLATDEIIRLSLSDGSRGNSAEIAAAIERLKARHILYDRGHAGGFCLWPHTSVNIEQAYARAREGVGVAAQRVATIVRNYIDERPLVARRHYIATGNLRHFEVRYTSVEGLLSALDFDRDHADGRIVIVLCETEEERQRATQQVTSGTLAEVHDLIIAVSSPLMTLGSLVQEVQIWEWIAANTPELANDSFGTEEVSRQIRNARRMLEERIRDIIGFGRSTHRGGLGWYYRGVPHVVSSAKELYSFLSDVCDHVYEAAPRIENELVNRRTLSSAAAGARARLLEGLFAFSNQPALGMDQAKRPPEMSMYLSILKRGDLHAEVDGEWVLTEPTEGNDPLNLLPALRRIRQLLQDQADRRVKVPEILSELRKAPYGVRDGVAPLLLALFAVVNEPHIAFYDSGMFMQRMAGLDVTRLTKVPDLFEIQYCEVKGVRRELFEKLLRALELTSSRRTPDVLDVVRPLCVFAAQLPEYTRKAKTLSPHARAVRDALLATQEPGPLIFHELPQACGLPAFTSSGRVKAQAAATFVYELKAAIDELRFAYLGLHERMAAALIHEFEASGSFAAVRPDLAERAQLALLSVKDSRLRAFTLRLADVNLPEAEWLDSLGSLLCSMPPARWSDADVGRYEQQLGELVARFRHVESIAFATRKGGGKNGNGQTAMRVAITRPDGAEVGDVIFVSHSEEDEVAELQKELVKLMRKKRRLGLAAAAGAFWTVLDQKEVLE